MRLAGVAIREPRDGEKLLLEEKQNLGRGQSSRSVRPALSTTWLEAVQAAVEDGDAELATDLGGRRESTAARLWHGQVLIDWQPDDQAGDCLLRPVLLRKLLAHVTHKSPSELELNVPGRAVAALSEQHADLVRRLGGARRLELILRLHFDNGTYIGGEETYSLVQRGQSRALLTLSARVRLRAHTASRRTSPAPR